MAERTPERSGNQSAELHVYGPHVAGLPNLRQYFRDLWNRWEFAAEFSRSGIKAANTSTVFGQLWLVLNPMLLALVYFVLVSVLAGPRTPQAAEEGTGAAALVTAPTSIDLLAHITCGLFLYYFFQGSVAAGANSVTGGGRLIMNMAFPRILMPLAAMRTAFIRFLPTVPVFLVIRAFTDEPWGIEMLAGLYFLLCVTIFGTGLAALVAAVQVYFRDMSSFLPYILRLWLYVSPVLWSMERMIGSKFETLAWFNPLFSMIGGWNQTMLSSQIPGWQVWVVSMAWALVALVVGSLFFISRERDFIVRL